MMYSQASCPPQFCLSALGTFSGLFSSTETVCPLFCDSSLISQMQRCTAFDQHYASGDLAQCNMVQTVGISLSWHSEGYHHCACRTSQTMDYITRRSTCQLQRVWLSITRRPTTPQTRKGATALSVAAPTTTITPAEPSSARWEPCITIWQPVMYSFLASSILLLIAPRTSQLNGNCTPMLESSVCYSEPSAPAQCHHVLLLMPAFAGYLVVHILKNGPGVCAEADRVHEQRKPGCDCLPHLE